MPLVANNPVLIFEVRPVLHCCQYCLYHCNHLWPLFCSRMENSKEPCQSARNSRRNSATGNQRAPITDFMAEMMMVAPPPPQGPASAAAQAAGAAAPAAGAGAGPALPLQGAQLQAIPPLRALVEFQPAFSKAK